MEFDDEILKNEIKTHKNEIETRKNRFKRKIQELKEWKSYSRCQKGI